jgi:hypothetical protein
MVHPIDMGQIIVSSVMSHHNSPTSHDFRGRPLSDDVVAMSILVLSALDGQWNCVKARQNRCGQFRPFECPFSISRAQILLPFVGQSISALWRRPPPGRICVSRPGPRSVLGSRRHRATEQQHQMQDAHRPSPSSSAIGRLHAKDVSIKVHAIDTAMPRRSGSRCSGRIALLAAARPRRQFPIRHR